METNLKDMKTFIQNADAILITAGAGMGVDSGLPDFRGNEGFWKAYPVIKDLGIGFEDMANPQWFETNPALAWAFYGHRFNLYKDTVPHKGFKMLLDLVATKNDDYFVYTSNVDGQFQKAGFSEDKIVEVHGSIHHFQCCINCENEIWSAYNEDIEIDMDKFKALNIPRCKYCDGTARPNILMFGDWSWNGSRTSQQKDNFNTWLKALQKEKKKLAIIEIGAGTVIPTIRDLGENIASHTQRNKLIRINPREFNINQRIGWSLPFGGLEGLEKILPSRQSNVKKI